MSPEQEKRVFQLSSEIAALIEHGDYTFSETLSALAKLSEYYTDNGRLLLSETNIKEIAQYSQHQYEKSAAALGKSIRDTASAAYNMR